tara:strand:+ start:758 stop:1207 length:450 start_codon:yes stop_codon:yes gene_type:complete
MKKAIEQAIEAYFMSEVPVGAIIIDNKNNIISANYNRVISMNDPTAHAEILCIREACKKLKKNNLRDCSIYITLEPCSMCASAISKSQLKNIFYGASDPKSGGIENGAKIFSHPQTHFKPNIYSGFEEKKIEHLMKKFFYELRNKNLAP